MGLYLTAILIIPADTLLGERYKTQGIIEDRSILKNIVKNFDGQETVDTPIISRKCALQDIGKEAGTESIPLTHSDTW